MTTIIRVMTAKRFVSSKFSGKVSAEGFLRAHWDFLIGQEYLTPILEVYDFLPRKPPALC